MTYYLKYRPQKLSDLDSTSARTLLTKLVASGKIPHALMFAGPKGTGKTSAARIIAKILNCLQTKESGKPCNRCSQCQAITKGSNIDVIEIDAASNRGIDDIRTIRESVKLAPAGGIKKVYIIDEAHMLTLEASNALLKTLEEPPSHVVFILATTNPEKLIPTIRSRTTEVVFPKAREEEIVASLKKIIRGEKLKLDPQALTLIAQVSGGSFRDGQKLLEEIVSQRLRSAGSVAQYLSLKGEETAGLLALLVTGRMTEALKLVESLVEKGVVMTDFIDELLDLARRSLLAKYGLGEDALAEFSTGDLCLLTELLFQAKADLVFSPLEQLPLEMALVKWRRETAGGEEIKVEPVVPVEDKKADLLPRSDSPTAKKQSFSDDRWRQILGEIKVVNTSIEALLKASKPISFDGKTLTLGVYYQFHKERLEESRYRLLLEKVVDKVLGHPARVVCCLTQQPKVKAENLRAPEAILTQEGNDDIVKIAKEVFGN